MEKTYANHLGKAVIKSEVFSLLEKKKEAMKSICCNQPVNQQLYVLGLSRESRPVGCI